MFPCLNTIIPCHLRDPPNPFWVPYSNPFAATIPEDSRSRKINIFLKIKVEISKISRSTPASPSSRNLLTYFCQWVFVLVWIRWLSRENLFSQKRERARKFLFFLHLKNISVNTQRGFPFTRTKALSGNTKKSFSSIHEKVFYQQM